MTKARKKRHSPEQIIRKLREAEVLLAEGVSLGDGDFEFLAADTRTSTAHVKEVVDELRGTSG